MRFIKKASIADLARVSEVYKEIELYTTREDFEDSKKNIEEIRNCYEKNKAIITAIHCPTSKYTTSLDNSLYKSVSTNYMSFCEIIADEKEHNLFLEICKFANDISEIYKKNNIDKEQKQNKEKNNYEDCDDDRHVKKNNEFNINIILHTGCIIGCNNEKNGFECPFSNVDSSNFNNINEFKCLISKEVSSESFNEILTTIKELQSVHIVFENITPYKCDDEIGGNSGFYNECFILAKELNRIIENKEMFGVVLDFCHIIATNSLLEKEGDELELLSTYLNSLNDDDKKLIRLCHLSNYNKFNGKHGDKFTQSDNDQKILNHIRSWTIKNIPLIPITLEVEGGEDVEVGIKNFNKMMIAWSEIHILLKDKIEAELYDFLEELFITYSLDYNNENREKMLISAQNIRNYVLEKSKLETKLFGFKNEKQDINMYLFQVQAFIYYVRYCYLAFDLINKYGNYKGITKILLHYMFNDELEEVKFDGLGSYYNIYWLKHNRNLYRCNDGCCGNETIKEKNFTEIVHSCFEHIGGKYKEKNYLSFSKSFGRVMLKYFNPAKKKFNIEICKNAPVNCLITTNNNEFTIQEYKDIKNEIQNFSIDFSDFYNGRGDGGREASLIALCEKVNNTTLGREKIGCIYDKEVIFANYIGLNVIKYNLSVGDYIVMMCSYKAIISCKSINDEKIEQVINNVKEKVMESKEIYEKKFNVEIYGIQDDIIVNILKIVDFEYEKQNEINFENEGFSVFAKQFKEIYINDFIK